MHAASTKSVREKLARGGGREIVDAVCLQRFDDLRAAESGFAADGVQAKISLARSPILSDRTTRR